MKIAMIQINPVIGDFVANSRAIVAGCARAAARGCELAILPELALSGYPPQDLLERPAFRAEHQRALEGLLADIRGIGVLCGAFVANPGSGKALTNAALLFAEGRILATVAKRLLPTYDVFDETRYFEPGPPVAPCRFKGINLGITICEDIWNVEEAAAAPTANRRGFLPPPAYGCDPVGELFAAAGGQKIDLLVNIAASPFAAGKYAFREKLLAGIGRRYRVPVAFVNQVGGQDTLVFDGGSLALAADGQPLARAARFAEDLLLFSLPVLPVGAKKMESDPVFDQGVTVQQCPGLGQADRRRAVLGTQAGPIAPSRDAAEQLQDDAAEILAALELGTRDYLRKCGFKKVVLGLSGGIDSALTAAIAARALGPEEVLGVALPSPYSSAAGRDDARTLATNLGIAWAEIPIAGALQAYLQTLAPLLGELPGTLTEQNIQARIRGNFLMAIANHQGRLLLSTGNKSETAVGYCTLYGDMSGGLAILADLPKTMVYRLCDWLNREGELIPGRTIERPPSAELAPNQRDDDDLPPYDILDPILQAYLEEQLPLAEIIARGFAPAVVEDVVNRVRRNEHKRRQAPPGLKISGKAFGPGRRYPIAENYRERIAR